MKRQYLRNQLKALFTIGVLTFYVAIIAQTTVTGIVLEEGTDGPVSGMSVSLKNSNLTTQTDDIGEFTLEGSIPESFILVFAIRDVILERAFVRTTDIMNIGKLNLPIQRSIAGREQAFTIQLADDDDDQGGSENISGLLTASSDIFQSAAAYTFGPMRFRVRGYESENSLLYLNGLPFNDLEVGSVFWSNWGGLNDVTRNQ